MDKAKLKEGEHVSNDLEEVTREYSFNIPSEIFNSISPTLQNIWKREIEDAFKAGANWQKEQIIEKACEWLTKHAKKYYFNKERYLGTEELVEDFEISMKM